MLGAGTWLAASLTSFTIFHSDTWNKDITAFHHRDRAWNWDKLLVVRIRIRLDTHGRSIEEITWMYTMLLGCMNSMHAWKLAIAPTLTSAGSFDQIDGTPGMHVTWLTLTQMTNKIASFQTRHRLTLLACLESAVKEVLPTWNHPHLRNEWRMCNRDLRPIHVRDKDVTACNS